MTLATNFLTDQKTMVLTGWYNSTPAGPAGLKMFQLGQKVTTAISDAASILTDAQVLTQIIAYKTYLLSINSTQTAFISAKLTALSTEQTNLQSDLTAVQIALAALNN